MDTALLNNLGSEIVERSPASRNPHAYDGFGTRCHRESQRED